MHSSAPSVRIHGDAVQSDPRPAEAAVRAVMTRTNAPAQWLANTAAIALQLLPQRGVALASIATRDNKAADWLPVAIGIGGTDDTDFAHRLERASRLSSEAGNRRGPFVGSGTLGAPTLFLSDIPDAAETPTCAYLGARRTLSLFSFLRASVRLPIDTQNIMLVIHVDGCTPDWTPTPAHSERLTQFTEAVSIGYTSRFVEPKQFQESLLEKLSQTQKIIVPYLMEEKSEREIASSIDRSRHTVHEHVKAIYQSWGVHSRHQAREVWLGRNPKAGV